MSTTVNGVPNNSLYNYSWVQSPPTGGSLSSLTIPDPTFTATIAGEYTWTVTATLKAAPYCSSTASVSRVINPDTSCPIVPTAPVCANSSNTYTADVAPATNETWVWSVNNGAAVNSIPVNGGQSVSVTAGSLSFTLTLTKTFANRALAPQVCTYNVQVNTCVTGHIFPTQTTCCSFSNGSAVELTNICYSYTKAKTVDNANPGVFFYYTRFKAPATSFRITVKQTKSHSGFKLFRTQQNQIRLWASDCGTSYLQEGVGGTEPYIYVTGAAPGATYVLSVKYDSKSIEGSTFSGAAPDVTYTFTAYTGAGANVLVPNSAGTIVAKDKALNCSSAYINPGTCPTPVAATVNVNSRNAETTDEQQVTVLKATAFPNPYSSTFKLNIQTPVSGMATIRFYTVNGAMLSEMRQYVQSGVDNVVNVQGTDKFKANTFYRINVGNYQANGKVVKPE